MANHVVTVDLQVKKTGSIKFKVSPWRVHSKPGDTVSWDFTGDIASGIIEQEFANRVWPFSGRNRMRGTKQKNAKTGRRRESGRDRIVIPYRVTVKFRDPEDGHL